MTRIMKAGEFKAKCLKVMDEVAETGETVIISKHGKPVARLAPIIERSGSLIGFAKGTVKTVGDVISPVVDQGWEREITRHWDEVNGAEPEKK